MKTRFIVFYSVLAFLLFLGCTAQSAIYTCSSCEDCTGVLGSAVAGDIVELTTDIVLESGSRCIDFGGSQGIVFDGGGHTVSREDIGFRYTGIYVRTATGTGNTIRNVEVTGFSTAVYLYEGSGHTMENCNIIGNRTGISMRNSKNNIVKQSLIRRNFKGIKFYRDSDNNIVRNSYIVQNNEGGIQFVPSLSSGDPENNRIYNNVISNMAKGNIVFDSVYDERDRDLSEIPFFFNTSLDCGQGNIMGCGCVGGNYWGEPLEQGFSRNCTDADSNGICDESYTLPHTRAVMIDNYPLTVPGVGCCANSDRDGDSIVSAVCGGTDHDDDPLDCGSSCHPGAPEICDGYDNDGDTMVDGTIVCEDKLFLKNGRLPDVVAKQSCVDVPSVRKIFCFGGSTYGTYGYLDTVVSYDPVLDRVELLPAKLPVGYGSLSCEYAPVTGKVYCFGGYWQEPGLNLRTDNILEFDPQDESLQVSAISLPTAMSSVATVWCDKTSSIFLLGGRSTHDGTSETVDTIMEFDPVGQTFQTRSAVLPEARYGHRCAKNSATGKIYCFEGYGDGGLFLGVIEYDPETDNVRVMNSAFSDEYYQSFSCVEDSVDNLIYCLGGNINPRISGSYSDKVLVFDPQSDTLTEKNARFLYGRYGLECTEVSATNKIYCFGGTTNVTNLSEIVEYTPALPIMGDVGNNGLLELSDLVQTLQVTVGLSPPILNRKSDIGGNRQLGLEEAAFILQTLAR